MLIHRRPSASMVSTFGVSGGGGVATTSPRVRVQRRSLGFGTLGMGTSGLVASHRSEKKFTFGGPGKSPAPHSWTHPEGWRDWPYEAPAPPRKGDGANS